MMNTLPIVSVPMPCYEDWSKMAVANDSRFCENCARNVIDFTSKSNAEIKEILLSNRGRSVCGRFRKEQIASVRISIPQSAFFKKMPFHRAFLLVLFTTMGSVLFSCSDDEGQKQAIEAVEVVEAPDDYRFTMGMVILPGDYAYDPDAAAEEDPGPDVAEDGSTSNKSAADSTVADTLSRIGHINEIDPKPADTLPGPAGLEIR